MQEPSHHNFKRWFIGSVLSALLMLLLVAAVTVVIDPFFHYHKPLSFLDYPIDEERYQNDGLLRHFDYDAVITGTSMTENFKCSQFDKLWGANSIKLPLAGAYYKETDQQLRRAIKETPGLRYVLRGLDEDMLLIDKDKDAYAEYPTYLYDHNPFNDVKYVLNKQILFEDIARVLKYTVIQIGTTPRDDYGNWMNTNPVFGKDAVLKTYPRPAKQTAEVRHLSEEQRDTLLANLEQNVLETVRSNPDITFYYFFAPYSVCYWHQQWAAGTLPMVMETQQTAIEAMLVYENLRLFGFDDAFERTCDLSVYTDFKHYNDVTSDWIMQCIFDGEHRLNQDNYLSYLETVKDFYSTYDYDRLYAETA